MVTKTKTITLQPKGKTTGTVSTTPTIDVALCNAARAAYSGAYYADAENQTGDAVSTLSNEYIMKIIKDVGSLNPTVPITTATFNYTGDRPAIVTAIVEAMATAETADSGPIPAMTQSIDVAASDIRSSAAAAALVMGNDAEIERILGGVIEGERLRKQSPGKLAFQLERDFVRKAPDGSILCNMIEGTGPEFDADKYYPWPIIGTREETKEGNKVNNPDLMKKSVKGGRAGLAWVSWYVEVVRMLPKGKAIYALKQEYDAAANKTAPSGRFADQASPDYLDQSTAEKRAAECQTDIDNMMKAIKKSVQLLRQMWAVNEMAPEGQPPRCKAEFKTEHKWNPETKTWEVDADKIAGTDSPIIVTDTVSKETLPFGIGEFLGMDTFTAAKNGGTLTDLRKAVGKAKQKRPGGTGAGQGATEAAGAANAKVVLTVDGMSNHFAALATSAETPAAWANFQRQLGMTDSDDALVSTWRVLTALEAMFATKEDFRKRVAKLEKLDLNTVDAMVGLHKDELKPSPAALNPAKRTG